MNEIIKADIEKILSSSIINWTRFRNKNVLITGANGMLPTYLVFTLLALNKYGYNVNVYALVRNKEKAEAKFDDFLHDPCLHLIVQDVAKSVSIDESIHFIIHAASQASPKYYGVDPVGTINANTLGTINTLELAREKKVEGYLFFSSNEIYGVVSPDKFPFKEEDYGYIDLLDVRSCYCESKRMGENLCVAYQRQYAVPTKIVRIFHTFGPGMMLDDRRVFADFCRDIIEGRDIVLRSDGKATRFFCYIADAVIAYLKVMLDGVEADAYNVANPDGEISMYNLAHLLTSIYPEKNLKVIQEIIPGDLITVKMKSPLQRAIPDCSKILKMGWIPSTSIKEGFKRTIESYTNNSLFYE